MRSISMARRTALSIPFGMIALAACDSEREPVPAPVASVPAPASSGPCPGGHSVDPTAGELSPARTAFEQKDYQRAKQLLDRLIREYPHSATTLVVRAEASLYEFKLAHGADRYASAADNALPFFERAEKLHDRGCHLPESLHYYLRIGTAYAHLRKHQPQPALEQLEVARRYWPHSAEVSYHLARAYCRQEKVEKCADYFAETLEIARALRRPRFLRTYHAMDDWIRRSRKQSEFPPLRRSPRYAEIISQARSDG